MNEMRKLMDLTENVYADEANKHIEGLAEIMANYIVSVSDDPYLYSDISEFSGGTLEARVTELIQAKRKGLEENIADTSRDDSDAFHAGWYAGEAAAMEGLGDVSHADYIEYKKSLQY